MEVKFIYSLQKTETTDFTDYTDAFDYENFFEATYSIEIET